MRKRVEDRDDTDECGDAEAEDPSHCQDEVLKESAVGNPEKIIYPYDEVKHELDSCRVCAGLLDMHVLQPHLQPH